MVTYNHQYDCRRCKNWTQRNDGRWVCSKIDSTIHGRGGEYPIFSDFRRTHQYAGRLICRAYKVNQPMYLGRCTAKSIRVSRNVTECGNCHGLFYVDNKFCPHCGATLEQSIDE